MSNRKLEKKLFLAKGSPDSIFDLSDCDLKSLPKIFALIKVLRKESLYLQNNKLSNINGGNFSDLSLLKLLDVSSNKIQKLPPEISHLKSLQVLRLDNNEINTLPEEIGRLSNLELLSLSSNKLSCIPQSMGNLQKLQLLDLRKNKLRSLPSTIYQNQNLTSLQLDEDNDWEDPPKNVIMQGTRVILSYFAEKNGAEDISSKSGVEGSGSEICGSLHRLSCYNKILQENLQQLEKEKEKKLQLKINSEKKISNQREKEFLQHQQNQNEKQKILSEILKHQRKIDDEISECQLKKKENQLKFLRNLQSVESIADDVINQLLRTNDALKQNSLKSLISSIAEDTPQEPISVRSQTAVLESMEKLLEEEYVLMKKCEEANSVRRHFLHISNLKETEFSSKVEDLLTKRRNQQTSLAHEIKKDFDLQYTALLMLIEKSDYRNIELQNQITVIQNQLSNLTAVELQNKNLNLNKNINELAERRNVLSELILQIFEQQQTHRKQLMQQLRESEIQHSTKFNNKYWLFQYQKLMNALPNGGYSLDSELIYELSLFGVSRYIPILSTLNLTPYDHSQITDSSLVKIGISSSADRCSILKAISHFLKRGPSAKLMPSAPELTQITTKPEVIFPSAPSITEMVHEETCHSLTQTMINKCVICMEKHSNVIFFSCGHLCCCIDCSVLILNCPLCRQDIERKIQVFNA